MPFPTYATEAEIPEAFRPEYEQRDGAWHPKLPDVTALQADIAAANARAAEEERKRLAAEALSLRLQREQDAKKSGATEEQLQAIRDAEKADREPIITERDQWRAKYEGIAFTDRIKSLALANGIMTDRIEDAMELLPKRARLGDQGGIVWKDKDGKDTAQTPEQFFAAYKAEKPWLFSFEGGSGGGTGRSAPTRTAAAPTESTVGIKKRQQVLGAL